MAINSSILNWILNFALNKDKIGVMGNLFNIFQIIFAVLLITLILMQQRGSGLGAAFGGEGNIYRSRRGIEKFLFYGTILIAFLFCLTAVLSVFLG